MIPGAGRIEMWRYLILNFALAASVGTASAAQHLDEFNKAKSTVGDAGGWTMYPPLSGQSRPLIEVIDGTWIRLDKVELKSDDDILRECSEHSVRFTKLN